MNKESNKILKSIYKSIRTNVLFILFLLLSLKNENETIETKGEQTDFLISCDFM